MKSPEPAIGLISRFIHRITPTCRDITRLLSEQMDHALPLHTRIILRLHLLVCNACTQYKHQLLSLRTAMLSYPPAPLSSEAMARIKKLLGKH